MSRVVVDLPDGHKIADQDARFETYLELSDRTDLLWSLKVNAARLQAAKPVSRDADAATPEALPAIGQSQRAGHADAVLRPIDGQWHLLRARAAAPVAIDDLGSAPLTQTATAALGTILGYDAVVIAQHGERVTAQTAQLTDGRDLYAVSFADSAQLYTLPPGQAIAKSALLRLVDSDGHLSTFKIVSAQSLAPLAVGTKLRLERRAAAADKAAD